MIKLAITLLKDSEILSLYPKLDPVGIEEIRNSITGLILEYCNTTFEPIDYTDEKYDSSSEIIPEHRPIISVSQITDTGILLTENIDYYVYPNRIFLENPSYLRKGIVISYKAGFPKVPEIVYIVARELLNYRHFKETQGAQLFYKSQTFEEREYQVNEDLDEQKILSKLSHLVQPLTISKSGSRIRIGII